MAFANLALRFLLEIAGFAGAGYAVYQLTSGVPGIPRVVLAVLAGLLVIGVWGFVAAPKRQNGLPQAAKDVIGSVILLLVAAAVWVAGQPGMALGFGVLVVVNAVLLFVFGQDARERLDPGRPSR